MGRCVHLLRCIHEPQVTQPRFCPARLGHRADRPGQASGANLPIEAVSERRSQTVAQSITNKPIRLTRKLE